MIPADWLQTLGEYALGGLWLPLLAWTVVTLATLGLLRLKPSIHTYIHYASRAALLLALPLGLLLASFVDFSFLALLPAPAAEVSGEAVPLLLEPGSLLPDAAPVVQWNLYHLLGGITLLAALLALVRLSILVRHAWALRLFCRHLPASGTSTIQHTADRIAEALGLRRTVRALTTTQSVVPMTVGWRRPLVVVPAALLDEADRLHMALLHELIHIRRRDALMQGIEQIISALFVINPLVSLLQRSIGAYREMVCDAEVLTQPRVSSKRYAALLYSFAVPPPFPRPLALSIASSEKQLKKRILAMKSLRTPTHRFFGPKIVSLLLAGLLLSTATLIVACTDLADPNAETTETQVSLGKMELDGKEVFEVVDQMPEIIGGLTAIEKELKYPKIARMAGMEGRIIIQFIVDEEGNVVDPRVVRGLGAGMDEEAVRALKTATFKPGMKDGKVVPVKLSIPVTFKLGTDDTAQREGSSEAFLTAVAEQLHTKMASTSDPERRAALQNLNDALQHKVQEIRDVREASGTSATETKSRLEQLKRDAGTLHEEIMRELMDNDVSLREEVILQKDLPEMVIVAAKPRLKVVDVKRTAEGITGRVVIEETGEAAPGANVNAIGSTAGVATDIKGRFLLKVSPDVTAFQVSFVGFDKVKFKVDSQISTGGDAVGAAKTPATRQDDLHLASSIELNSVHVTSNGTTLRENMDYYVDYPAGTVTVTNAAVLSYGRSVNISFEPSLFGDL